MSQQVELFKSTFNRLTSHSMALLDELYADNVVFTDPFRRIEGLAGLRAYFARQYRDVIRCTIAFEDQIVQDRSAMLTWTMHLDHASFCKGQTIQVPGASHIRFDRKLVYHRDYFDAGTLLYERIPLLRAVVRRVKSKCRGGPHFNQEGS